MQSKTFDLVDSKITSPLFPQKNSLGRVADFNMIGFLAF